MTAAALALLLATPLPTPFTADAICAGMPVGAVLDLNVTGTQGDAQAQLQVIDATPTTLTMRATRTTADGPQPPVAATHTCADLRDHAAFDRATARRRRARVDTPWGPLRGWRYVVLEGPTTVTTYEFADAMPGPPVRMWTVKDGVEVTRMVQVGRQPGPPR